MPDNINTNKDDDAASSSMTRQAFRGTLSNMLVRLVSFGCTQIAFRLLKDDIAALGRASIQLELLLTTTLFMSREGFRLSLTRDHYYLSSSNGSHSTVWNVAWLTIPVSTLASSLALLWHLHQSQQQEQQAADDGDHRDYQYGGMLYCLAAWIEGVAEPAVLHSLRNMNVSLRVSAEGAATLCKTFVTVLALKRWLPDGRPIFALGVAQVSYGVVYFIVLYSKTWKELKGPRRIANDNNNDSSNNSNVWFDGRTCYMTVLFTIQGLFKHLLTEGDRIVLSTLSDGYDQGVYAMGSAYGGLAARFLLQPLEENARLLWSRLQSSQSDTNTTNNINNDQKDKQTNTTKQKQYQRLEQSYLVLVKLVLYVGFTFCCLATNYTSILLNILAGSKWGSNEEAVAVLSAFCIYTAFLAWNGMTEAFVFGVATSGGDIGRMGLMHTVVGLFFAVTAPLCVSQWGTIGLVAANCMAMMLRSLYSVYFAASYCATRHNNLLMTDAKDKPITLTVVAMMRRLLTKMFPHILVVLSFAVSAAVTHTSMEWLNTAQKEGSAIKGTKLWYLYALRHIGLGGVCFVGILIVAFALEKEFRSSIRMLLRAKED